MVTKIKTHLNSLFLQFPPLMWLKLRLKYRLRLKNTLQRQLRFVHNDTSEKQAVKYRKILLIQNETQHYQMYQMFILCKALEMRGCEIKILVCNSYFDGCETKNAQNYKMKDPCLNCRFNLTYVLPAFELPLVEPADFISPAERKELREKAVLISQIYPSQYTYKDIDIIPMTNDSVERFFFGDVTSNEALLAEVRKNHLTTSMMGIEIAERLHEQYHPDIVLNTMYVYSVAEPYYRYFKKNGVQLTTITITPADYYGIMINMMDLYKGQSRFSRYVRFRGNGKLDDNELKALKDLVNARFRGETDMFNGFGYFGGNENIRERITIDENKRNIFLFSNVLWDIGELGVLFPGIAEWVLQTIEMIKDKDNIHLYIKPHPGEKYDSLSSLKGIEDIIREKYPEMPENVTIIRPELKIKPYDFFQYIDLGVVFYGTLGLEMLLHDIPVLLAANPPYSGMGVAYEPKTLEEYKKILLGEVEHMKPDKDLIQLFAYFYFLRSTIPWNLTKQAYDDCRFEGFMFNSLDDITPGKNKYLDHICNCILNPQNTVIEGW